MATIIITIILNLLVGTPSDPQTTQDEDSTTTTTTTPGNVTTMGGTGTWTNTDK